MINMQKTLDVAVVGELNVDVILNRIDSFPKMGAEILARDMTVALGSSSAIFASNLSTLGAKTGFLGKVGRDNFGELVLASLQEKGVDTSAIIRSEQHHTGATIVLNYEEDRAMVTYPGAMAHLEAGEISDEWLRRARHLHFSSYYLQPALRPDIGRMFRRAKALGLTTSMDPQWDPQEEWAFDFEGILPYVDVFLPNEKELLLLTGKGELQAALGAIAPLAHIVAVKQGSRGSLLWRDGQSRHLPAFLNKNVVDAIGAGDSFNAGFISRFVQGAPLEACQEFGNLSGAVSTTAAGGTAAFQSLESVLSIAREKLGYGK